MADTEPAPAGKKISTWLKAAIGAMGGVLIGAVATNASAFLDRFIKPTKPLANFAVDHEGTTVTFHNRSTSTNSGWWDFGDGSPLEPVDPKQEIVRHAYPAPGDYTAKLQVNNLIGDESERTVTVHLDPAHALDAAPDIQTFDVAPVSPGCYAPATFKITSRIKNAQAAVWDYGDDQPLDIHTDNVNQDKFVTFKKPGGYVIKLAAVNGAKSEEKTEIVNVLQPPRGMVTAVLSVADQGTHVETLTTSYTFTDAFAAPARDSTRTIDHQAPARPGFIITDVRLATGQSMRQQGKNELAVDAGANARDLRLALAADQQSVRLTGQVLKDPSKRSGATPTLLLPVVLVQEKRTPANCPPVPVSANVSVPGSVMLSLPTVPSDWVDVHRQLRLELRDGELPLVQEAQLPQGVPVAIRNHRFLLTAVQVGEQVRIDIADARGRP